MTPIFGGVNPWKQIKSDSNHIVVGTPGKILEFCEKRQINLQSKCSFVVLDEADLLLNGFKKQVDDILCFARIDR